MKELLTATHSLDFIQGLLKVHRARRGYKARLADAAGCQRSYFSQVLGARAHLSSDQALRLATYLKLNDFETELWVTMVSRDRAGTRELREFYQRQLNELKARADDLTTRYRPPSLNESERASYYSDPVYALLHMAVTIPELATIGQLAKRLKIEEGAIEAALRKLEDLGLVARKGVKWSVTERSIHVGRDSTFGLMHHQNWRMQAVKSAASKPKSGIHYTAIYTLSHKDAALLRQKVLGWIDESRALVGPSAEETLSCLTVDLFEP